MNEDDFCTECGKTLVSAWGGWECLNPDCTEFPSYGWKPSPDADRADRIIDERKGK